MALQSNPDNGSAVCSDNVDYANKDFNINGYFEAIADDTSMSTGVFTMSNEWNGYCSLGQWFRYGEYSYTFKYTLNGMPVSEQETRPKSKFFSLLIYAGYPIA